MRLLLDEHLPIGLAAEFPGHAVHTVSGRGWTGIKNGELLRRMNGQYDALVTMDRSIEFQQRIATLRFGIVLVRARLPIQLVQAAQPPREVAGHGWRRRAGCRS